MIITMRHIRAAQICSTGVRDFCDRYSINYNDFLKNGIEEELLLLKHTDAIILEIIKVAHNGK